MFIERDFSMRPVTDFLKNIKNRFTDDKVAEEICQNGILIGWEIKNLIN